MWRINGREALEANGFRQEETADRNAWGALIASGKPDAREEPVEIARGARMRALDAIERRPDLDALGNAETVTGTRRGGGQLHGLSEDHGKGEEIEERWVDRFVDDLKNPALTESPADRVDNAKRRIYVDRKGRPWPLEGP